MSKAMIDMAVAAETGKGAYGSLEDYAKVANMSTREFADTMKNDAVKAITAFIIGLGDTENTGKSTLKLLNDLGITEVRLRDTMLRATNASELFTNAIELGNKAWENNSALTNEADKRYSTLKSKIKIAVNQLKDLAITFGDKLTPIIPKVTKKIEQLTDWVSNLNEEQVEGIVKVTAFVAVLSPLLNILGKVTSTAGTAVKGLGLFTQALAVSRGEITSTSTAVNGLATIFSPFTKSIDTVNGKITSTSTAVNGLSTVFSKLTSPVGIACTVITGAVAAIAIAANESQKKVTKSFENMYDSASDFVNGIDTATSHLDSFNSKLFVSNEEQEQLATQMQEIQQKITNICQTASNERRDYTKQEVEQLNKYFAKLNELNQRELEVQTSIFR